ncbi:pre-mRNA-splicing factor CWC25 homolog [Sitophilus oryzae]|uniref:Pre-mRNA-splicing factor CWC25 homolog n=1 Tax=Sitophilus oryzae TaxID=7048 RepID=A0A6J2Y4Z0_SITOR|nr:pre-mRNA-splicing factor CWC25 homolog [Sitophilus oryzae]
MAEEEKLDWIYKSANSLVSREEYLLGRKVDKTLDELNKEEKEKKIVLPTPKNHVEHECIPPSIRDFNKIVQSEQVDLSAKLQEDPLVAIRKREEEARRKFLQNPVQLKKLQDALKEQEKTKKNKKSQKERDLDQKLKEKLRLYGKSPASKKGKTKVKDEALNTILMHKFNALKSKLSDSDLNDILNGKTSSSSSSDSSNESDKDKKGKRKKYKSSSDSDDNRKKIKIKPDERKQKLRNRYNRSRDKSTRDTGRERYSESKKRYKKRSKSRSNSRNRHIRKGRRDDSDSSSEYEKSRRSVHGSSNSKQKKNRRHSSESSEDEKSAYLKSNKSNDDLDEKILRKLRMLRDAAEISNERMICDRDESNCKIQKNANSSGSDNDNSKISNKRLLLPEKPSHLKYQNESNDSSSSESSKAYHDSEEDKKEKKNYGLVSSDGKKLALKKNQKSNIAEIQPVKTQVVKVTTERKNVKKLTDKEKEKIRNEMMQNAEVRDREREENVRKYREKDKAEESVSTKFDTDLIHNQLLKSAKHSSIEDRIKSNLNNIQRSARHMDSNFSKR